MADFSLTQLNAVIKELWDTKVEEARYAEGVIMNRVANRSEVAKQKGDRIHVSIDQKFSVSNVGADGTFTPTNYTVANSEITLDQWKVVPIQVLDQAASQSFWTPESTFPTMAGRAFANQYDADLAGLHTSASKTVGDTGAPAAFTKGSAQEALFNLADANVPMTNLSFILHPSAYMGGILNETQLTDAEKTGMGKSPLINGQVANLIGVPVFLSTNIVEVAGPPAYKANLLLHRSALSIAWSKTNTVERTRSTANLTLADLLVMQSVYGYAAIRTDHYTRIVTSASGTF